MGSSAFRTMDGWMDVWGFFYRRSTPKGHIASTRLYKNTILHYELVWKKLEIFKIDRII